MGWEDWERGGRDCRDCRDRDCGDLRGLQQGCGERSNGGSGLHQLHTSYWVTSGEDYRHYTLYKLWASELEIDAVVIFR